MDTALNFEIIMKKVLHPSLGQFFSYCTNKCTALLASKQPQNLYDIYLMLYVQF